MKDRLTREEVLHVADLARIKVNEEEIEKYQVELKQLLDDVEKVNDVVGYDEEILIAPWDHDADLRVDEVGEMINKDAVLKNAPSHSGNYITVPVVIGESEGA